MGKSGKQEARRTSAPSIQFAAPTALVLGEPALPWPKRSDRLLQLIASRTFALLFPSTVSIAPSYSDLVLTSVAGALTNTFFTVFTDLPLR